MNIYSKRIISVVKMNRSYSGGHVDESREVKRGKAHRKGRNCFSK
jgi:hypothetical protein